MNIKDIADIALVESGETASSPIESFAADSAVDIAVALVEDAIEAVRAGEDPKGVLEELLINIKGMNDKGGDNQ